MNRHRDQIPLFLCPRPFGRTLLQPFLDVFVDLHCILPSSFLLFYARLGAAFKGVYDFDAGGPGRWFIAIMGLSGPIYPFENIGLDCAAGQYEQRGQPVLNKDLDTHAHVPSRDSHCMTGAVSPATCVVSRRPWLPV
jgi:hypothetical protein